MKIPNLFSDLRRRMAANKARLAACPWHQFEAEADHDYLCSKCQGRVSSREYAIHLAAQAQVVGRIVQILGLPPGPVEEVLALVAARDSMAAAEKDVVLRSVIAYWQRNRPVHPSPEAILLERAEEAVAQRAGGTLDPIVQLLRVLAAVDWSRRPVPHPVKPGGQLHPGREATRILHLLGFSS